MASEDKKEDKKEIQPWTCPKCGSKETELRNYNMMWHDGDVHCAGCGEFVRTWDAG